MIKKIFIIILCFILMTGCWDRRELNQIGIVLAVGLDKDPTTGKIVLTIQVVNPASLKEQSATDNPIELISAEGDTVFEAIRNISKQFDRQSFFSHNKVLIISEELAKEGILTFYDLFGRGQEVRHLVWLIIAKDVSSSEVLGEINGVETVQAIYMDNMIKNHKLSSEVSVSTLLDLVKKVTTCGINPVTGVIELTQEPNFPAENKKEKSSKLISLSGTGILKDDKLVGFLNNRETLGLNFVIGKISNTVITVHDPNEPDKLISVELKNVKSEIKPKRKEDTFLFNIQVNCKGGITEYQGSSDIYKLEVFEKIQEEVNKTIKTVMESSIDIVQKKYKSDVFGFGSSVSKKYPKQWKELKTFWDDSIFPAVEYTINVNTELKNTGLLQKPFKTILKEETK